MDDTDPKTVCTQTESSWVRLNVLLWNAGKTNPEQTHFNWFCLLAFSNYQLVGSAEDQIFRCIMTFPCFTFRVKESRLDCLWWRWRWRHYCLLMCH